LQFCRIAELQKGRKERPTWMRARYFLQFCNSAILQFS
jgi:hypothetical protein